MSEQILQKIRNAYQNATAGDWKLMKMQDGQLRIMNGNTVIAIVNRLEDGVFIETAFRLLPGMMNSIRNIPVPAAVPKQVTEVVAKPVAKVETPVEAPKKKAGRPKVTKAETPAVSPEAKVFVPKVQPKGVTIPVIELPKNGTLEVL